MPAHVINDKNFRKFLRPVIGGEKKSRGLKPRDYSTHPVGCYAFAEPFPDELLIPEDEIEGRIKDQEGAHSSLLDLRAQKYDVLQSLDQDGKGLCWAFSSTKAMMYLRAIMNEPDLILSAWWVAGKVKHWQDEGGWGGESLAEIVKEGVPAMSFCPSYQSSFDTPETRANAALHKALEWYEGSSDPDKAFHQSATAHVLGLPTIEDFNFWSHSVCGVKTNSYKNPEKCIDNSWGASAGDKGIFILKGSKAKPNGLWIGRVTLPSVI